MPPSSLNLAQALLASQARFHRVRFALISYIDVADAAIAKKEKQLRRLSRLFAKARANEVTIEVPADRGSPSTTLGKEDVDRAHSAILFAQDLATDHPRILLEMAFVYLVAAYDAFFQDSIHSTLTRVPLALKSGGRSLTYETIIDLGGMDNIVEHMVLKEVQDLTYKSVRDQVTYLKERFKLSIVDADVPLNKLIEINARRNLLLHAGGVVNRIYLSSSESTTAKLGDQVGVTIDYLEHSSDTLWKAAINLSTGLIKKFYKGSEKELDEALKESGMAPS